MRTKCLNKVTQEKTVIPGYKAFYFQRKFLAGGAL